MKMKKKMMKGVMVREPHRLAFLLAFIKTPSAKLIGKSNGNPVYQCGPAIYIVHSNPEAVERWEFDDFMAKKWNGLVDFIPND